MSWASYLFNDLNDKNVPVTRLAPSTDEKITEKISASTSLYTTESNEAFTSIMIFESFHHQAKIPILIGLCWRASSDVAEMMRGADATA